VIVQSTVMFSFQETSIFNEMEIQIGRCKMSEQNRCEKREYAIWIAAQQNAYRRAMATTRRASNLLESIVGGVCRQEHPHDLPGHHREEHHLSHRAGNGIRTDS
jgi:hypothetical protein